MNYIIDELKIYFTDLSAVYNASLDGIFEHFPDIRSSVQITKMS